LVVRFAAICGVRLLRRFLRRLAGALVEVLIRHLQVVLGCDGRAIADPLAHHVHGERLGQFRFPGSAKILKQLGPRLETGSADDSL
jgi:hypothetical protein